MNVEGKGTRSAVQNNIIERLREQLDLKIKAELSYSCETVLHTDLQMIAAELGISDMNIQSFTKGQLCATVKGRYIRIRVSENANDLRITETEIDQYFTNGAIPQYSRDLLLALSPFFIPREEIPMDAQSIKKHLIFFQKQIYPVLIQIDESVPQVNNRASRNPMITADDDDSL